MLGAVVKAGRQINAVLINHEDRMISPL